MREKKAKDIIISGVEGCADTATALIDGKFTAGSLINGIYNAGGSLNEDDNNFLMKLLRLCDQNIKASSDKYGYGSDHRDYIMDLIEAYLKIYPDRVESFMFNNNNYLYFDSDVYVRPRNEKYFFDGKTPRADL